MEEKKCVNCGYELDDDWLFCPNCSKCLNEKVNNRKSCYWIYILIFFIAIILWMINIFGWWFLTIIAFIDIVIAKIRYPKVMAIRILFDISMFFFIIIMTLILAFQSVC